MDDTEKLVQMMGRCGLATGHGDTIDDLIFELEKQIKNISHAFSDAQKEIERLRVWNNLVENKWMWIESALQFIAMAKPLDGQTWEKHSKQIKDYAIKALEWKEKEEINRLKHMIAQYKLYDDGPYLDDNGNNLDGN